MSKKQFLIVYGDFCPGAFLKYITEAECQLENYLHRDTIAEILALEVGETIEDPGNMYDLIVRLKDAE